MNCETCQIELEDFLYGELDAAQRASIAEHLSVCADCREMQATLERENEVFAAFYEQNALEPGDEMWQAIHARIQPDVAQASVKQADWTQKIRNWFAPLLVPAMLRQVGFAALLVLLSVGLTTLYFSSRKVGTNQIAETKPTPVPTATPTPAESTKPATPAPSLPAPSAKESSKSQVATIKTPAPKAETKPAVPQKLTEDEALAQQIAKATREYQGAIRLLERTIAKRKPELEEGTIKQFEGSLAMIDASIAASRQAMQAHPNDPTAARYLLAAYSKKVELMQEIAMR
ncbi:MAG: zf-HC2 domain-containing protein [Acidobacteria bacterium]|nr:zf-HC2 domain-containing protein [Acidobacteriota bacterium]